MKGFKRTSQWGRAIPSAYGSYSFTSSFLLLEWFVAEMVIIGMILFFCRNVLGYAFSREKEVLGHDLSLYNHGWLTSSTFRGLLEEVAGSIWEPMSILGHVI
ncbi:hypothetical protein CFP56_011291 [Quercus suber]|uniref:Uncharacterized protein n=1 Tax=Quercus suber TaxID=58331 RepID=A0AAW0MBZ3_QUESU